MTDSTDTLNGGRLGGSDPEQPPHRLRSQSGHEPAAGRGGEFQAAVQGTQGGPATPAITAKLTRIYLVVAFWLIFSASAVAQLYLYHHCRAVSHENLGILAASLAHNLESAVAIGDSDFAKQTLDSLQHYPDLRLAAVILPDGKYFAKYASNDGPNQEDALRALLAQDDFMTAGEHGVSQALALPDKASARLVLIASLDRLNRESLLMLGQCTAIGILIYLVAYMLFRRMSQAVTLPIEELAAVKGKVKGGENPAQSAGIVGNDEIGGLARGINSMPTALEKPDSSHQVELRQPKAMNANQCIDPAVFESPEGMFITDAASVILRVNRSFSDITGYTADEAVGHTTRLLNSGHHDAEYFAAMRESLKHKGAWQGEIWNRRKNGEVFPSWLTITAVKNEKGELSNYIATLTDISSRKTKEDEIGYLAFYDPLTQLPNRQLLSDRLEHSLASCNRSERYGALLFVDMDNFKTLNDTSGYDYGDLLLKRVAQRLVSCVREGDTVSHLSGDEFVVILENLSSEPAEAAGQARLVGEKLLATLGQPYQLFGAEHQCTSSIGIALFVNHGENIDHLLKRADLALYQAKTAGRNTLRFFGPEMLAAVKTPHGAARRIQSAA